MDRKTFRMHYERMLNSVRPEEPRPRAAHIGNDEESAHAMCILCLSIIWRTLPLSLELQQKETVLLMLSKLSRSASRPTQVECLSALFAIAGVLAQHKDIAFTSCSSF